MGRAPCCTLKCTLFPPLHIQYTHAHPLHTEIVIHAVCLPSEHVTCRWLSFMSTFPRCNLNEAYHWKPAWSPLTWNLLNDRETELVNIMTQRHEISQEEYLNANRHQSFLYLPRGCLLRVQPRVQVLLYFLVMQSSDSCAAESTLPGCSTRGAIGSLNVFKCNLRVESKSWTCSIFLISKSNWMTSHLNSPSSPTVQHHAAFTLSEVYCLCCEAHAFSLRSNFSHSHALMTPLHSPLPST